MTQIFKVNPFAEAMAYYFEKANDNRVEKRFVEASKRFPQHKETLEKTIKQVILLEKLLDSKLTVDDKLVNKYFKKFDDLNAKFPFGFCLASIMVCYPLMDHLEYSTAEMCEYLRNCSMKERMYSLCFGLLDNCETLYVVESGIEEFSHRLENMRLPIEDKYKIQSAAFNYQKHLNELFSLIIPAAELIEASLNEFDDIIREFHERYSADNAYALLKSCFESQLPPSDIIYAAPMLFEFDNKSAQFTSNDDNGAEEHDHIVDSPYIGKIFFGIARHLINKSTHDEISALSEKMKALSDNTRLEILFYLCSHREYGQELCARFGLQRSALSYHITKLLTAGFVSAELIGTQTYYTADKAGIQRMLDAFAEKIK